MLGHWLNEGHYIGFQFRIQFCRIQFQLKFQFQLWQFQFNSNYGNSNSIQFIFQWWQFQFNSNSNDDNSNFIPIPEFELAINSNSGAELTPALVYTELLHLLRVHVCKSSVSMIFRWSVCIVFRFLHVPVEHNPQYVFTIVIVFSNKPKMSAVENGEECLLATCCGYGKTILLIKLLVACFQTPRFAK